MDLKKKRDLRRKRVWRIRKKVNGTAGRPRLCVHFSNKHIYAQAIDDRAGRTLIAASTLDKATRPEGLKANVPGAAQLGKALAQKAVAAGLESVVFDRNGRLYHGAVKAFADAAREGGLKF